MQVHVGHLWSCREAENDPFPHKCAFYGPSMTWTRVAGIGSLTWYANAYNKLQESPNNQVREGKVYRHKALGFHRDKNAQQPYRLPAAATCRRNFRDRDP